MKNKHKYLRSKKILVLGIFIIFVVLLNLVNATIISSTMSVNMSFNQTPLLNQTINLTYSLLSSENATDTIANITLSSGIELIGGSINWSGSLIENVTKNNSIIFRINSTGNSSNAFYSPLLQHDLIFDFY